MILLLALLAGAASPTLQLSFPARASGPCKAARFAAAIEERRPSWTVLFGEEQRPADARVQLEQQSGRWTLTLLRAGEAPLHRALPPDGNDCVETANTAALILDRALEDLVWRGDEVHLAPLRAPLPDPPRAPLPPAPADTPEEVPRQLWLELGAGAATSFGAIRPAGSLALSGRRGGWSLALALGGALAASGPVGGDGAIGCYSAWALDARALLGRAVALGPGALRFELGPGLLVARASASGALLGQQSPAAGAAPFAAARLGYELPLPARFALGLRVEVRLLPHATSFAVEGYPGDFSSSHAAANVALGVSRRFF